MPLLLATAIRYLGATGIVALGLVIFYEGLPLGPIRYVPWVGPQLEQLVDGRVDRVYRRGEQAERLVWERRVADAERRQRAELDAKQDELDQLALEYYNLKAETRLQVVRLKDEIVAARQEDENAPAGTVPLCRRYIPKRLSDQLNAIR